MNEVVIVSAVRTAVGKFGGTLKTVQPEDLAQITISEAIKRAGIQPESVDEVIFGQTKQSSDAPNLARVAALKAELPIEVPAYTVMRQCGSGLQAVINGAQAIACGQATTIVAGGTENMSAAPYYLRNARFGYTAGNAVLIDSNTESQPKSQPESIFGTFGMGMTAENLADKYGISREEQDEFALGSQQKAAAAIKSGRFDDELIPVTVPNRKGDITFEVDEFPRESTSEALAKLKPVFKEGGSVTAGNSSGRNDGAACLVVMSAAEAKKQGLKSLAKIKSYAASGVSPDIMGIGPAPATRKALELAGLRLDEIGLIELNEAFAAQSLAVIRELGLNPDIVNVNGGAIALGHPLGCSGARILTTLLYEMQKKKVQYGLATICIAGGQGLSLIVEAT